MYGCIDPEASNFNSEATVGDGGCTHDIPGCTDSRALNFVVDATKDDGSCVLPVLGCMSTMAPRNMPYISLTFFVSHPLRSPLKEVAF